MDAEDLQSAIRTCSLSHFCEIHGPSVVFNTQTVHSSSSLYHFPSSFQRSRQHISKLLEGRDSEKIHFYFPKDPKIDGLEDDHSLLIQELDLATQLFDGANFSRPISPEPSDAESDGDIENLLKSDGVELTTSKSQRKSSRVHVTIRSPVSKSQDKSSQRDTFPKTCLSCGSIPQGSGLLSIDEETDTFHISSNFPSPSTYSRVRTACVQSLSAEVCPGREGPILFGCTPYNTASPTQEWTLTYIFKLKDITARGSARSYSFLFITSDHDKLVQSMEYITSYFSHIVKDMQRTANKLFALESAEKSNLAKVTAPVRTHGVFRRPTATTSVRSLTNLMQDDHFFTKLHKQFCWLSKSVERLHTVRHLHRPIPMFVHNVPTNQINRKSEGGAIFHKEVDFLDIYEALGATCLRTLIFNTLIGNQVIIRGRSQVKPLMEWLLTLLSHLIPTSLSRMLTYSEEYVPHWKCNLLGVEEKVRIEETLDPTSQVLIDIQLDQDSDSYGFQTFGSDTLVTTLGEDMEKVMLAPSSIAFKTQKLEQLKEEWIDKARIFYVLSLRVDDEKDIRIKKFLKTLNLVAGDLLILRFWSAGLKSQFTRY